MRTDLKFADTCWRQMWNSNTLLRQDGKFPTLVEARWEVSNTCWGQTWSLLTLVRRNTRFPTLADHRCEGVNTQLQYGVFQIANTVNIFSAAMTLTTSCNIQFLGRIVITSTIFPALVGWSFLTAPIVPHVEQFFQPPFISGRMVNLCCENHFLQHCFFSDGSLNLM